MQRATLGKNGFVVTRSDSESNCQQQFGESHGDDGCYSIYFDSSTCNRLAPRVTIKISNDGSWAYWCSNSAKTSRHRQNGLSHVPKKMLTWMLREARGGLKATIGNRITI